MAVGRVVAPAGWLARLSKPVRQSRARQPKPKPTPASQQPATTQTQPQATSAGSCVLLWLCASEFAFKLESELGATTSGANEWLALLPVATCKRVSELIFDSHTRRDTKRIPTLWDSPSLRDATCGLAAGSVDALCWLAGWLVALKLYPRLRLPLECGADRSEDDG